ncbi:L-lysine 6-transaminase [Leekyejoonella antrihumi]|uniref:L-lysine-epsilon aminotransferase n=1 Tax=Leekyejoonella antrihumi TaxID=1660198 RepID=A0A563E2V4_9MICO|nr:L-lysine 6-transaminase [Leekyejoonella antrihumi]TWP36870.1 L-lysine 6-transaminase [Leekyejoonella antrihumi]
MTISADKVRQSLSDHVQVDAFDLVVDLERSQGSHLVDEVTGTTYLDFYTFFASCPLGLNPPQLAGAQFERRLLTAARNKPANSDAYTTYLAEFVETFARVAGDPRLPHLFFVEGGALAVENALKTAFDWKSRRNEAAGRSPELGMQVMHLTKAFHGRSGYTMSLTNTEPVKVARYPKFDWPRIDVPAITFPLEEHLDEVGAAEQHALQQARAAFERFPDDIACFLAEPIQSEGGDNHLRPQFLQAMQQLCREHNALFVLDEVQTGLGLTGTTWCYQQLGLEPDIVAFAKKAQVGGIMAGGRVDEVADNVFQVSSRINSTWGGGLADMVRSQALLEAIEETGAVQNAAAMGSVLLSQLQDLARRHPNTVSNARGRGLLCAIDLPDGQLRGQVLSRLFTDEHVLLLPCGDRSIRFRPILSVTEEDLTRATAALDRVLSSLTDSRGEG